MKHLMIAAVIAATPAALAHELDSETTAVSAQQVERAKDLPATTVVRINKKDPSDVQVAFVKEPIRAGEKVANLNFEKVAKNAEKVGIAFNSSNELDATSSTSSWVFAAGGFRRPYYGYAGYRPYYGGGGYYYPQQAYYYNSYYSPYYRPMYTPYYSAAYYPSYAYAGYNYSYYPYYTYADAGYNYAYCGWMY